MPSFMKSTLSLSFIICVLSVIVMVFMEIEPNQVTFWVITAVVSAFLTNYWTIKKNEPEIKKDNDSKPIVEDKIDDLYADKLEAHDTTNQ